MRKIEHEGLWDRETPHGRETSSELSTLLFAMENLKTSAAFDHGKWGVLCVI